MMHVSMMILGYATLLCGSLLSVAILVITFQELIQIIGKSKNFYFLNESFSFAEIKYMNMTDKNNVLQKTSFLSYRKKNLAFVGAPMAICNEPWACCLGRLHTRGGGTTQSDVHNLMLLFFCLKQLEIKRSNWLYFKYKWSDNSSFLLADVFVIMWNCMIC